jgi:pimeloyl-ACP methyl ester carboxylesterase
VYYNLHDVKNKYNINKTRRFPMKLDFSKMDIGTFQFNFVRTLTVAPTGGAEVSECLKAAALIKDNDEEGWVKEWASIAADAAQTGEKALQAGQTAAARRAFLRASNYYRTAMFSLAPTDERLQNYLRLSREIFQQAAPLFTPQIEVIEIPFENARLPGYFLSAGAGSRPTLLLINGGDSTNEEIVHWMGFAAQSRGWNFCLFEGPGQWSALQLNPGLVYRADYEAPVKAVVDYLLQRDDVDPDRLALVGLSLSSQLAARVVAFEKRIRACICVGGIVVDVNEAWEAVMPAALRNALPGVFDRVFAGMEKANPSLRGFVNHFRWSFGVTKPHELLEAWRPFNIKGLAPKIECPLLVLMGEGEYEQIDAKTTLTILRFMSELTCPVSVHEFRYTDGWAASHCSVGDVGPANLAIFDWLDRTVIQNDQPVKPASQHDWSLLKKYHHTNEIDRLLQGLRVFDA